MAVIVSDTTPLNYLVLIGAVELLPKLYGRVFIPPAVRQESSHPKAPEAVRIWLASSPRWLEIVAPSIIPPNLSRSLDAGEVEAIALALETRAHLLLIEERDGAAVAQELGRAVTGTLGVLDQAARLGLIDLPTAFARLEKTTFRSPARLIADLLAQDAARKAKGE
jgi:predicted nucleic acid-binding protein